MVILFHLFYLFILLFGKKFHIANHYMLKQQPSNWTGINVRVIANIYIFFHLPNLFPKLGQNPIKLYKAVKGLAHVSSSYLNVSEMS